MDFSTTQPGKSLARSPVPGPRSPAWAAVLAWVRAESRRRAPAWCADDIAGEVVLALIERSSSGVPVTSVLGLSRAIMIRRVARAFRLGRVESVSGLEMDRFAQVTKSPGGTEPPGTPCQLHVRAAPRGIVQRQIVEGVIAGRRLSEVAGLLGKSEKQVRRAADRMVRRMTRMSKKLEESVRELTPRGTR